MDFLNKITKNTAPYVPGEQPKNVEGLIKINTNENPYPPSPKVAEAIAAELPRLPLYPDTRAGEACRAFSEVYSVPESRVFCANGSDEVLAFAYMAFWDAERPLVTPALGYSFYPVYAERFEVPLETVTMRGELEVDVDALCAAKGGVIIANPNAPTSIMLPLSDIRRILLAHSSDVVLVDEAYADFGGESAMKLIGEFPNLLVVRTLSKSHSLAGLRVGFAVGQEHLIDGLERVKNTFNSYTIDRLANVGAAAALRDRDHFAKNLAAVIATRDRVTAELLALGFELPWSSTNFLFAKHPQFSGEALFSELRDENIIVRRFATPALRDYLRISIGTDSEMDRLVKSVSTAVGK